MDLKSERGRLKMIWGIMVEMNMNDLGLQIEIAQNQMNGEEQSIWTTIEWYISSCSESQSLGIKALTLLLLLLLFVSLFACLCPPNSHDILPVTFEGLRSWKFATITKY